MFGVVTIFDLLRGEGGGSKCNLLYIVCTMYPPNKGWKWREILKTLDYQQNLYRGGKGIIKYQYFEYLLKHANNRILKEHEDIADFFLFILVLQLLVVISSAEISTSKIILVFFCVTISRLLLQIKLDFWSISLFLDFICISN